MRSRKKQRFSLVTHQVTGRELRAALDLLFGVQLRLAHAYPLSHPAFVALEKSRLLINRARSSLDDSVAQEFPDSSDLEFNACYYPGANDAAQLIQTDAVLDFPVSS